MARHFMPMIISCWAAETVSPMLALLLIWQRPSAIQISMSARIPTAPGAWLTAGRRSTVLVYDPLFAEAKNYNKYYGAPYGVYELPSNPSCSTLREIRREQKMKQTRALAFISAVVLLSRSQQQPPWRQLILWKA